MPKNKQLVVVKNKKKKNTGNRAGNGASPLGNNSTAAASRLVVRGLGLPGSYGRVVASRIGTPGSAGVQRYLRMVLDPLQRDYSSRYPDETIAPTGMTQFAQTATYAVQADGTFKTVLCSKVVSTPAPTSGLPWATINLPMIAAAAMSPADYADYGTSQSSWTPLSSVDRTLAAGICVRLTALPPATFLASGSYYFLQLQQDELNSFLSAPGFNEAQCIQAVNAGKGFMLTGAELMRASGITVPILPQGPMSYLFSDTNNVAALVSPTGAGTATSVVSACPSVAVIGFGINTGTNLRFDYAHHVEYIPSPGAAGVVATRVQPPSMQSREAIARSIARVSSNLAGSKTSSAIMNAFGSAIKMAGLGLGYAAGGPAGAAVGGAVTDALRPLIGRGDRARIADELQGVIDGMDRALAFGELD